MNEVLFRFTLYNSTLGTSVIDEPVGWDEAKIKLERDKEYHGVIEFYDQSLVFHQGDDLDGGYSYVKNVFETQGPDADITITIELSNDEGRTYETLFSGLVDLSSYIEIDSYKIQCSIIRNDVWSKFYNRKNVAVDVQSSTDLDGNSRTVLSTKTINLSSQKIRKNYYGKLTDPIGFYQDNFAAADYIKLDVDADDIDEIDDKFNYFSEVTSTLPLSLFSMAEAGTYTFDIRIECGLYAQTYGGTNPPGCTAGETKTSTNTRVTWYIQKNDNSPIAFSKSNTAYSTVNTYSGSMSLIKGDEIRIYAIIDADIDDGLHYTNTFVIYAKNTSLDVNNRTGDAANCVFFTGTESTVTRSFTSTEDEPTYISISADTIYTDTTAEMIMIHECFQSVLDRIIGANNTLYSEYLGRANTQGRSYGSSGCASAFCHLKGIHIRSYSFSEKIMSVSFNDLWDANNPIFNLAIQYKNISGTDVIEILNKDDIYESGISIYLSYVNEIERSVDTSNTFTNIKIGYQKWESEDFTGIDDPQTKHEYATPLKKIGEEITLHSKAIAASIAIESTRRQKLEKGADYKLDNDLFIIALDKSDLSSSVYNPDLDDDFSSISGLLNSDARYNMTLTPGRNFLRWYKFFNGAFYDFYSSNSYKFVAGEGNYDFSATQSGSCSEAGALDEGANISMGIEQGYHSNVMLEFEYPLDWEDYKTIRDNKNKKIMVSATNENYEACYIDSIEYELTQGKAKFKLWKV